MTETSSGHLEFLGFTIFAIVVGAILWAVIAITARRRKLPLALVAKPSPTKRAIFLVATTLLLLAACAAETPTLLLTGGPPTVPHSLAGREGQCLLCHEQGVGGATKAPANHVGRTADMCALCHMPAAASAYSPEVGISTSPRVMDTPLPARGAAPPPAGEPPKIPHSLAGRDQCLGCHEAGVAGAPQVPANHAGRTSDMCRLCHVPAAPPGDSPAVSGTVAPAKTATVLPAVGASPAQAGGPPLIPHSLQGREGQCLMCHESGVAGATKVPANHAGRTSDICTGCHQPSAAGS